MKHRFTLPALAGLAALALAACHGHADSPKATQAWVRLPAVAGRPAAAYFTLHGGGAPERLVKVESALAGRAELHASMKGMAGMTTMTPVDGIDLPAGGTIAFAPAGYHVMLFGLDAAVKPGTAVPIRFGFASGRTIEGEAKTVPAGGDAPY